MASGNDQDLIAKLPKFENKYLVKLEEAIDDMQSVLPPMKNFILPGGHVVSSYCHIARCVCRGQKRLTIES